MNVNVSLMVENVTQIKIGIMINAGVSAKIQKNIMHVKKMKFGILLHIVAKIDNSVITCDEIINAADSVSTNVLTNLMSTASINFHNKKTRHKMNCYILHTVLLVVILPVVIAIICYPYAKHRSKQKNIGTLTT